MRAAALALVLAMNAPAAAEAPVVAAVDEAEVAVLGGALIDTGALVRARAIVEPSMFSAPRHGPIWSAFLALHDRGVTVDVITVAWLAWWTRSRVPPTSNTTPASSRSETDETGFGGPWTASASPSTPRPWTRSSTRRRSS